MFCMLLIILFYFVKFVFHSIFMYFLDALANEHCFLNYIFIHDNQGRIVLIIFFFIFSNAPTNEKRDC